MSLIAGPIILKLAGRALDAASPDASSATSLKSMLFEVPSFIAAGNAAAAIELIILKSVSLVTVSTKKLTLSMSLNHS